MINNGANIVNFNTIDAGLLSVQSSIEEIIYAITGLITFPVTLSENGEVGFVDEAGNIVARLDKKENALEVYSDGVGYIISNIIQERDSDLKFLQKIFGASFEITKIPQDDGSIVFVDASRNTLAIKTANGEFNILKPDGSIEVYNSRKELLFDSESCSSAVYDTHQSKNTQNSAKRFSNDSANFVDPLTDPVMRLFQMSLEVRINEKGEREYFDAFGVKIATLFEDGRMAVYLTDGSVEYYSSDGQPIGAEVASMNCSMPAESFEEENYQPSLVKNTVEPKNDEQKQNASTATQTASNESARSDEPGITSSDSSNSLETESIAVSSNVDALDDLDVPNENIEVNTKNSTTAHSSEVNEPKILVLNDPFILTPQSKITSSSSPLAIESAALLSAETNSSIVIYNNRSSLPESIVLKRSILAQIAISSDGAVIYHPVSQGQNSKTATLNNTNVNLANVGAEVFTGHSSQNVKHENLNKKSANVFAKLSDDTQTRNSRSSSKPAIGFGNDSIDQNSDKVIVVLGAHPSWVMQISKDSSMMLASSDAPKNANSEKITSAEDRGHGRNPQDSDKEGRKGNEEEYVVIDDDEEDSANLA